MNEKKLDLILQKMDRFETEQNRQGEMVAQLIGIVKSTNEKVSDLQVHVGDLQIHVSDLQIRMQSVENKVTAIQQGQEEISKRHSRQLDDHEYNIEILHRNQLRLETEIEKIKHG